jgi:putative ABC transport system permease protein
MLGLAQALGAIILCAAVIALCGWFSVHVEREAAISIARGLVQMVFVGTVLAALLHGALVIGSGITALVVVLLARGRAFSPAAQLILRRTGAGAKKA